MKKEKNIISLIEYKKRKESEMKLKNSHSDNSSKSAKKTDKKDLKSKKAHSNEVYYMSNYRGNHQNSNLIEEELENHSATQKTIDPVIKRKNKKESNVISLHAYSQKKNQSMKIKKAGHYSKYAVKEGLSVAAITLMLLFAFNLFLGKESSLSDRNLASLPTSQSESRKPASNPIIKAKDKELKPYVILGKKPESSEYKGF